MWFGRGRNWFGRGFWKWGAYGGFRSPYPGGGWGRGNPYPFCRRFPWLPRGWWMMPHYQGRPPIGYPAYGGRMPGVWPAPAGNEAEVEQR